MSLVLRFKTNHDKTGSLAPLIRRYLRGEMRMAVYKYKLIDGTGGTYRTGATTIEQATKELKRKYGKRLDVASVERVTAS